MELLEEVLEHLQGTDKVLVAIYNKYQQGQEVVTFADLEGECFTKLEIFAAIEAGLQRGFINGDHEIYSSEQILLTAKGRYYIQALLEKEKGID